jgi:aminoglycoside phosphotransferase (APT) family kinase protein
MKLETQGGGSFVDAVRRFHLGCPGEHDVDLLNPCGFRLLGTGFNNAVYTFDAGSGEPLCLKCYCVDERRRAEREWAALCALEAASVYVAPRPVSFHPDPVSPVVIMERITGEPLGHTRLTVIQAAALADSVRECQRALLPGDPGVPAHAVWGDAPSLLRRVSAFFADERLSSKEAARDAKALWREWFGREGELRSVCSVPPPVFSRGDPNLANCLWDGERIRIVDWEYSGWGDRILDAADTVEHIQSRHTPDTVWEAFTLRFGLSEVEQARYEALRRLVALFWVMKLWPEDASTSRERFASQVRRAELLVSS